MIPPTSGLEEHIVDCELRCGLIRNAIPAHPVTAGYVTLKVYLIRNTFGPWKIIEESSKNGIRKRGSRSYSTSIFTRDKNQKISRKVGILKMTKAFLRRKFH